MWGQVDAADRALLSELEPLFASRYISRLSKVKQLGLMSRIVPECDHSRLEHSVGAVHVVLKILRHLQDRFVDPIPKDLLRDMVAAMLLHDATHYPFSHATERALIPSAPLKFATHKHYLPALIELIRKEEPNLLSEESAQRIAWLLQVGTRRNGENATSSKAIESKYGLQPWHRQIIASAIDADRLDYIPRDLRYSKLLALPTVDFTNISLQLVQRLCVVPLETLEGGTCQVLALDYDGLPVAAHFLILRFLLYAYGYFSPHLRGLEGAYILMLRLLNNIVPLRDDVPNEGSKPEECALQFVINHNDETFSAWLKQVYDKRVQKENNSNIRQFLEDTYSISVGIQAVGHVRPFSKCGSCRYADISPYFQHEIGDWSGWSKLIEYVNQRLADHGKWWTIMPDVLNPEHDETKEFYVRGPDSQLSLLSQHLSVVSRLFAQRVERLDFYVSPLADDDASIGEFVRSSIVARLCRKGG